MTNGVDLQGSRKPSLWTETDQQEASILCFSFFFYPHFLFSKDHNPFFENANKIGFNNISFRDVRLYDCFKAFWKKNRLWTFISWDTQVWMSTCFTSRISFHFYNCDFTTKGNFHASRWKLDEMLNTVLTVKFATPLHNWDFKSVSRSAISLSSNLTHFQTKEERNGGNTKKEDKKEKQRLIV